MKNLKVIAAGVFGVVLFSAPFVFADTTYTASIDSLTPSATVLAKSMVKFHITTSGFIAQSYILNDSFGKGSTANTSNIDPAGKFAWNPVVSDVGTHTFTIIANDYSGNTATVSQTITVSPPPSITITSVLPGAQIMPGTKYSFSVAQTGFTNPTYIVGDSFSGSTVGNVTINSSGNFSWTPSTSDNGEHTITVYASDSSGQSNTANVFVRVGAGPTLTAQSISPGTNIVPGQALTLTVSPTNYTPSGFSVTDSFPGSSISNTNINTSGQFSWMPGGDQVGKHVLTFQGIVGAFGQSATTSITVNVFGSGGVPAETTTSTPAPSATPSDSALSALQAQLALLNSRIAAQSAVTPSSSTAPASAFGSFTAYLYQGMDSDEVTHLQTVLKQQELFSGDINGHFGPLTVAAVKKFQEAHGLTQLGVVGPSTRAALNALDSGAVAGASTDTSTSSDKYVFENFIALGQRGTDVTELQKRLISLGLLMGDATEYFGTMTEAAVKAFQNAHGLDTKGYVGIGTRAALNK